jgi:hypothetical protein
MNQINRLLKLVIAISVIALAGCRAEKDVVAVTAKLPTDTRIPSTATHILPTDTPIPPTDTPVLPTDTPPPPSDTPFPVTDTPALPTEEFTRTVNWGDGYVAHIPISEAKDLSSEEIVTLLVNQYLEHYRTETTLSGWRLLTYKVEDVTIVYEAEDKSPFIKAAVVYWVIPDSPWYTAGALDTSDPWGLPAWSYARGYAVHGNVPGSSYYWLRSAPTP